MQPRQPRQQERLGLAPFVLDGPGKLSIKRIPKEFAQGGKDEKKDTRKRATGMGFGCLTLKLAEILGSLKNCPPNCLSFLSFFFF